MEKPKGTFWPTQYFGYYSWCSGLNTGPAAHRVPADSHLAIFSGLEPPLGQQGVQRDLRTAEPHSWKGLGQLSFPIVFMGQETKFQVPKVTQ